MLSLASQVGLGSEPGPLVQAIIDARRNKVGCWSSGIGFQKDNASVGCGNGNCCCESCTDDTEKYQEVIAGEMHREWCMVRVLEIIAG